GGGRGVQQGGLQGGGGGVRRGGAAGRDDLALVDGRVEPDEVHALAPRRLEEDRHVALAVEAAAVAHVAVVEQQRVDVRGLGPADALDRDGDVAPGRHDLRLHQSGARGDHVPDGRVHVAGHGAQGVPAAQVVGRLEGHRERAGVVRLRLLEDPLYLLPPLAADAVAGDAAPHQVYRRAGGEALAAHLDGAADRAGAVVEAQRRAVALGGDGA